MDLKSIREIAADLMTLDPRSAASNLKALGGEHADAVLTVLREMRSKIDRIMELSGSGPAPAENLAPTAEEQAMLTKAVHALYGNGYPDLACRLSDYLDRVGPRPTTIADLKPGDRFRFPGMTWTLFVDDDGNINANGLIIRRAEFLADAVVERIAKPEEKGP